MRPAEFRIYSAHFSRRHANWLTVGVRNAHCARVISSSGVWPLSPLAVYRLFCLWLLAAQPLPALIRWPLDVRRPDLKRPTSSIPALPFDLVESQAARQCEQIHYPARLRFTALLRGWLHPCGKPRPHFRTWEVKSPLCPWPLNQKPPSFLKCEALKFKKGHGGNHSTQRVEVM